MSKTIVVTGTATGLGKATVEKFAREGWNVVASVRKRSDLNAFSHTPNVETLIFDVTEEDAAPAFAALAFQRFGRVDALVNNAGYYQVGPLEDTTMEQVHHQFQTNVFGLISVTKALLPSFREQGSGAVINIASLSAEQGYPYSAVYASSKAAVAILSEALNIEMAEFGVIVKAILPGQHATQIYTKMDVAEDVSGAYQDGIKAFFSKNSPTASAPSVTADVIYEAVVDTRISKVRYYSGPDAVAIPRAKQVLGLDGYWDEFRTSILDRPTALFSALVPPPGDAPVAFELRL